ncbi:MAG: phosphoenolpyruvate--protein phosphotransferase [Oscillospiraceae bacterium]|nr:phosphoenolpyruvate--protein phosphotransferase [Oscillospiraceae bacterium]
MKYKGNPVSPGIGLGNVYLYKPFNMEVAEATITKDSTEAAVQQYLDLRDKAHEELIAIKEELLLTGNNDKACIVDAQASMLLDVMMNSEVEKLIRDSLFSLESAVEKTYSKYADIFSKAKSQQIRERATDLKDLKTRLHRIWFGVEEQSLASLEKEAIIVAHDLFPSDTARLDRSKVLAIVTEIGGSTSHSAIIARSYEIPAILGIDGIMKKLTDGEPVIVDAIEGVLHTSPEKSTYDHYTKVLLSYLEQAREIKQYLDVEPVTQDGTRIEVNLNIGSEKPEELSGSPYTDGVGLFRTEFMYMEGSTLPTEEEQYLAYRKVALEFGKRPVIIRTLDIGGDKQIESFKLPKEENPFLGLRALRLCFGNPSLFQTQIRAVLRAACHGNLWLMLPMVGSLDDIRKAKEMIEEVKKDLDKEGVEYVANIPVGIMIEIPAIALIAELVSEEVDFASIGTNDLCQYLTAVDRLNPAVSEYYQSYHPAMLRLIKHIVSAFSAAGKSISVCGELGGEPAAVALLIGIGLRKLSMGMSSIPKIKKLITGLTIEKAEALAEKAMTCKTANEVEQCLKEGIKNLI